MDDKDGQTTYFERFAKRLVSDLFGDSGDITVLTWDEEGIARLERIIEERTYDLAFQIVKGFVVPDMPDERVSLLIHAMTENIKLPKDKEQ